jgi:hypothetical protein
MGVFLLCKNKGSDYLDDLHLQLQEQIYQYFQRIEGRIKEIYKDAIQDTIYIYNPTVYERTYTFINSVKTHINFETGVMYVYSDLDGQDYDYPSAVDGSSQSDNISNFLEGGHHDGGIGEYHDFNARRYLEKAQDMIQAEFPDLKTKILENEEID